MSPAAIQTIGCTCGASTAPINASNRRCPELVRRTVVSVVMVIAFAALCLFGLGFIALNMGLHGPWSNEFALNAEFASANGLVPQAEVRVSGVHVGTVLAIGDAMDAPTRKAMSESFQQLGIALDGREQDIGAALPPLDDTVANLRPLARVGEARQKELDRILTNLNVIMQALADEQDQLGHLVDSGDTVMSGIASRDQALAGTVQNGAAVFGSLDQAFSGVTAANRASLQKSPSTIAAGRRTLSLTNPQVDQLLPEILLGQISYPNDQLNISDAESLTLAAEWISAFSHQDAAGIHSLRITGINPSTQKTTIAVPGGGTVPA